MVEVFDIRGLGWGLGDFNIRGRGLLLPHVLTCDEDRRGPGKDERADCDVVWRGPRSGWKSELSFLLGTRIGRVRMCQP